MTRRLWMGCGAAVVGSLLACEPRTEVNNAGLTLRGSPVLGSASFPGGIASDPSMQPIDGGWIGAYTCLDAEGVHTAICMARSEDGVRWEAVEPLVAGAPPGTVLVAAPPETALEGAALVVDGNTVTLFASTYGASSDPAVGFPATLLRFEGTLEPLAFAAPTVALAPEAGTGSCHAVYSPTVRRGTDGWEMVFTGHCYEAEQPEGAVNGLTLLRATSPDGRNWTSQGTATVFDATGPFAGGIAEPSFVTGRDDLLLVSSGFLEGESRQTHVARAGADGRFVADPEPLLSPREGFDGCGAFAPDAHVVGDRLRIWYLALSCETLFSVGLAEGPADLL